jgi:hypothetical protein
LNFDNHKSDVERLSELQKLYSAVHRYFLKKAGHYELPEELLQEDEEAKELEK